MMSIDVRSIRQLKACWSVIDSFLNIIVNKRKLNVDIQCDYYGDTSANHIIIFTVFRTTTTKATSSTTTSINFYNNDNFYYLFQHLWNIYQSIYHYIYVTLLMRYLRTKHIHCNCFIQWFTRGSFSFVTVVLWTNPYIKLSCSMYSKKEEVWFIERTHDDYIHLFTFIHS